jgi:O-methyltransferase
MGSAKFERDGLNLTRRLLDYVQGATVRETAIQEEIRAYTAALPEAVMMSPPEQGQLMAVLARLVRAERMVEVGVFTGYSATWLAGSLPDHGVLVACDMDEDWMAVARGFWERAGLAERIDGRVGPGAESMQKLLDEGWGGTVDLIFVDADKTGYSTYYHLGLQLLRPGGILLFDNVLWSGEVANPENREGNTEALREVVRVAAADSDVHAAVLTDADGLLLVMKPY